MTILPKSEAMERLNGLLQHIPDLKSYSLGSPEFTKWQRDAQVTISKIFGESPDHRKKFDDVQYYSSVSSSSGVERRRRTHPAYERGLDKAEAIIESMIEEIKTWWADDPDDDVPSQSPMQMELSIAKDIFLVHGHDHGTKETVARFLQGLDLKPIILHEQPNQGRTIIEKFEDYARTSYAIALLTPDDVGGLDADQLKPRARQNVILEMGFFWGSLGRGRVAALLKDDLVVPSDYDGVVYIELDDNDGWQMKLARELKAAGFDIDLNKLA
ncbi:MAG: nucleotide-binding protein [Chloroflexota bacterium]|nr:nucleotide-binding protein [Chloroflexota bacterium]